MKILITGATGFIGRHVVENLLSLGTYRLITTATKSKEEANNHFPLLKKTEYISKDLNQKEDNYYAFFQRPDVLIHLGWEGLPNYNELFHIEKNLPANFNFIKNMIENGLDNITISGTCFEYGIQSGCLHENMITAPVTAYGLAKDTLRKSIELLQSKYRFDMKWIRLFYLYGDGQGRKTLLGQLEEAIKANQKEFNMSKGEQLRDYISVDHAAELIRKIALQNNVTGIINCCSGKPVSVRSFVEEYLRERNIKIKLNLGYYHYQDHEPLAFWGDNTKLNNLLCK